MVRCSDSEEASEDECTSLPTSSTTQKSTMLDFFKRRPASSSKKATIAAASNGHNIDNKSGNTTKVAGSSASNRSTQHTSSSNLKTTKASVKQTTADKKRKKDEVVTNGDCHSRGSNKSPPPKKRIEDNCEKDEVSNALKNASSSCTTTKKSATTTSSATAASGETTPSTATVGSTTVSSSSPGISNFFRTISKKEFIADSAKNQSITVVKALVHQSMSSEGNRISASQTASIETKTTTASNSISQQTTLIESDNSKSSKKRKRRGSKYVRRSDEIDVIQILTDNEEDGKPRKVVEKHTHCEKAEKEKKEDRRRNSLSSPEVNPPSTTVEMETECDLAQGPKSSLNNGGGLPSLEAAATDAATVNLISTKQMFKPKKNKSKRKASEILEDEDTVDLDLPNVKTRKRPKDDVIKDQDNNKTVLNDLTFLRENDDNQNNSDEKENNVTTSSKVAGRNAIPISESSKEQKKNCNSKVEDNNCTEETPVVKVSLFKNKQPKKRRRASGKNAKKGNTKELHYDSDSIDIDVLATFSARTFAQSTGISPPTESSNLEDNAFAVLMKKPLTKSVIKNEDVEEKPIDDDTKVLSQHAPCEPIPSSTAPTTDNVKVEHSRRTVQQDNAFSRLMAPKGKLAKENAVPQNDNVPTAINVVNQEPPASTTSITTTVTTSEVATPKTKLNTSSQARCIDDDDGSINTTTSKPSSKMNQEKQPSGKTSKLRRRRKRILEPEITDEDSVEAVVIPKEKEVKVVGGHVEEEKAVEVLNSSANDFVEVPNVPSKKEPINVLQEDSTSSNPRRKSERIKRIVEVNYQEQTEKMISAQDEESLEAVVVEKQQHPRRSRRSVKKDAIQEKNGILENDEGEEEGNSDDDDIKIDKIIVKNNTKNSSTSSGSKMAPIFLQRSNAKSGAKTSSSKTPTTVAASVEVDPVKLAARKAFLLSSVPDSVKDIHRRKMAEADQSETWVTPFASKMGHVRQFPKEWEEERRRLPKHPDVVEVSTASNNQDSRPHTTSGLKCSMRKIDEECLGEVGKPMSEESGSRPTSTSSSSCGKPMVGYHGTMIGEALERQRKDKEKTSRQEAVGGSNHQTPMERKIQRLTASQIYCQLLSIRQEATAAEHSTGGNNLHEVTKIFRRYLERKIEADTLEDEARTMNVSLNEIEEERNKGLARRRLRSRRKKSNKKSKTAPVVSRINSKVDSGVKYDPNLVSSMQWTMKYAPQCAEDVIGNARVVKDLASWLGEWEARDVKRRRRLNEGDSSDGYSSDSDVSDEFLDEEDLPNTALLLGPNGVGKTASVYALAHEMGFKVLEVNASSSRNGRQVLTNLREATQSHDVRKRDGGTNNLVWQKQSSQQESNALKADSSTSSVPDRTALILFEDIDLFFGEADEGFYSAVNSLIATTKRPILLTTSKSSFLAMQDSTKSKVLKLLPQAFTFSSVEAEAAARHLQLMALVEGFIIDLNSLRTFCRLHNGNVSQAILDLQCLLTSSASSSSSISPLNEFQKNEEEKDKKLDSTTDTNTESSKAIHSHNDVVEKDTENEKIVRLMSLELPLSATSTSKTSTCEPRHFDILHDLISQEKLHPPSISEWEYTTNMVLQDCCNYQNEQNNVDSSILLGGHRGCSGDADFHTSVTEDFVGVEANATTATTGEAPTHQNALSSANNSATITKPLENGSGLLLGDGDGSSRGLFPPASTTTNTTRRLVVPNLHSEVFADARLPQEEPVVEAVGAAEKTEMEQKTKKSWHHPNEEKTTLAAASKKATNTEAAATACTTTTTKPVPKGFRKNKQMLNDVSKRAEMASLFWPQLCTCCQHDETKASRRNYQHHDAAGGDGGGLLQGGGGEGMAYRGHKWRLRNTSCPEPPVHWSSVCNDLVASYIHNGGSTRPRPSRLLNTKDLQMTSSSTAANPKLITTVAATTKATTTAAVVVKEEAGGSTAHTRDNNETKNEENDLLIFEAHEDALNSFEYGGSMSRKMAFMDILPVLRTMLRSEAARKDTILEVKRSNRAGRFLHYLDSIGLHLDETTRMVLQRPFSIL